MLFRPLWNLLKDELLCIFTIMETNYCAMQTHPAGPKHVNKKNRGQGPNIRTCKLGVGPQKLQGEAFHMSGDVKYLGVILDPWWAWRQLARIKRKSEEELMLARHTYEKHVG